MKNQELIKNELSKLGYVIGIYSPLMENLTQRGLSDVMTMMKEEYTDVDVRINRKHYVVEICTVDNEKDFNILSKSEYKARYGSSRWED